jgi:DNA polymerase
MFVGEAPVESEDRLGVPFVGRSGELLTSLLAEVGITRDEVFISNVVKCRPPGNRDPKPQEVESCSPWLHRQIEIIGPDLICTLGNFATKLLRGDDTGISKVHGQLEEVTVGAATLKLYPLFHPAAALRSKTTLAHLRSDLAAIPRIIQGSQDVPRQADHAKDDC